MGIESVPAAGDEGCVSSDGRGGGWSPLSRLAKPYPGVVPAPACVIPKVVYSLGTYLSKPMHATHERVPSIQVRGELEGVGRLLARGPRHLKSAASAKEDASADEAENRG